MAQYGYAGSILKVDLSKGSSERMETAEYSDRFIGGRGIAAKLYWDLVPPEARAFDPENGLIYTVMGIICRYRKGVTVSRIQELTGYDAKKIANIVYKGKQRGQIKSIDKGVYLEA